MIVKKAIFGGAKYRLVSSVLICKKDFLPSSWPNENDVNFLFYFFAYHPTYFLGDTVEKCSYSSRKCLKKVSAVLLVAKMHTILQNVFSSAEIFLTKSQRTICTFVANKKNTLHFM